MKLIILGIAIATSSFTSCNSSNPDKSPGNSINTDTGKVTNQPDLVVQKDSASIEQNTCA